MRDLLKVTRFRKFALGASSSPLQTGGSFDKPAALAAVLSGLTGKMAHICGLRFEPAYSMHVQVSKRAKSEPLLMK